MVLIMILVGLLALVQSSSNPIRSSIRTARHRQTLMRAAPAQQQAVPSDAFCMRKAYFTAKDTGILRAKVPKGANPMMNPMGMVDMMKAT